MLKSSQSRGTHIDCSITVSELPKPGGVIGLVVITVLLLRRGMDKEDREQNKHTVEKEEDLLLFAPDTFIFSRVHTHSKQRVLSVEGKSIGLCSLYCRTPPVLLEGNLQKSLTKKGRKEE